MVLELLTPEEKKLFARLSVFRGGCTLEAAEEIAEADLDTLESLLDQSLLRHARVEPLPRFWMLETIREFAVEALEDSGEAEELRQRHASWCFQFAEEAEKGVEGPGQESWAKRLDAEADNLRAALEHLENQDDATAQLELLSALGFFWEMQGRAAEGGRLVAQALDRASDVEPLLVSRTLRVAWLCAMVEGEFAQARRHAENRLAIGEKLDDPSEVARALFGLGLAVVELGEIDEAAALFERSAGLAGDLGDERLRSGAVFGSASIALLEGNYRRAEELFEETLAFDRSLGDTIGVGQGLVALGWVALGLDDPPTSASHFRQALDLSLRVGMTQRVADCLDGLAGVAAAQRNASRAARLAGAATSLRSKAGVSAEIVERTMAAQTEQLGRPLLGDELWDVECAHGVGMTLDDALAYALSVSEIA